MTARVVLERLDVPLAESPNPPDLKTPEKSTFGFSIREDVAFTDANGADGGALAKRARSTLQHLQAPLSKILEPAETVLYFSPGQLMPDSPERYMLGVGYRILTRGGLILTTHRILYMPLKRGGHWTRSVRGVRWTDIRSFHLIEGMRGRLVLNYGNGQSETFWQIPKGAMAKLKALMESQVKSLPTGTPSVKGMVSYCPQCFAELVPGKYECPQCKLKFKDEKGALVHGLTIPGGAFFYADLHLLGIAHGFGDASLLFSAIAAGLTYLGRIPTRPVGRLMIGKWFFATTAILLLASLIADIWVSIRVSKKLVRNFIPRS